MLHKAYTVLLLGAILSFSLTSCDSSDPDIDPNLLLGQGTVTVEGSINSNFTGMAFWRQIGKIEGRPGEQIYVILIFNTSNMDQIEFAEHVALSGLGTIPGNGSHPIGDYEEGGYTDSTIAMYTLGDMSSDFTTVISQSGTLFISHGVANSVAGTFSFEGITLNSENPGSPVTVSGAFNALNTQIDIPMEARQILANYTEQIQQMFAD